MGGSIIKRRESATTFRITQSNREQRGKAMLPVKIFLIIYFNMSYSVLMILLIQFQNCLGLFIPFVSVMEILLDFVLFFLFL